MAENAKTATQVTIKRIGGYLHKVVEVVDGTGKVLNSAVTPFMVELRPRDILQILVGASVLAIPVGLTEEAWILGTELALANVIVLSAISLLFIALFVYFNFYRFHMKGHVWEYLKRVCAIYGLSLLVVGILLTVIDKCPWDTAPILAMKRIIIAAFPASMSATISDTIK
jgi:uncharacterized membrane protein